MFLKRRMQVALGEIEEFHPWFPAKGIVIPVVGRDAAGQQWDGLGNEVKHVRPQAELEVEPCSEFVQSINVGREVSM